MTLLGVHGFAHSLAVAVFVEDDIALVLHELEKNPSISSGIPPQISDGAYPAFTKNPHDFCPPAWRSLKAVPSGL
jgi:hypothetical protein